MITDKHNYFTFSVMITIQHLFYVKCILERKAGMNKNLIILIKKSKCSCTKYGRTANDKKRLCKPKKNQENRFVFYQNNPFRFLSADKA
ncbi:MAG: hypothetical protein AVO38_15980 [delta proteobacterium ML8_D]|nr:MAG: hypothetical protein AVO38_15980 [delta proteobacterium ML8_D]